MMKKTIRVGDVAPVINTTDLWGNAVNIPTNDKWIYLSFHRFAACPFCNLRTNELKRHYHQSKEKNIEIVSVWPSGKETLLHHAAGGEHLFPMLSDTAKNFYKAYGVTESSMAGALRLMLHPQLMVKALRKKYKNIKVDSDPMLMPASFLINPEGIIRMAYYGKHYADHPKVETILAMAGQ